MILDTFLVVENSKYHKKSASQFHAVFEIVFFLFSGHFGDPLGTHWGTRNHSKITVFTRGPPRGVPGGSQEVPEGDLGVIFG